MTREVRKYVYSILVALGPVAVFYGLATQEEVALWLGVGGTVLAGPAGLVALNNLTPTAGTPVDEDPIEVENEAPKHAE